MKIINKRDEKIIIRALYEAIQTYDSLIDAHRVGYSKRRNGERCIPEEYRKDVQGWNRMIGQFKRTINKLRKEN
jgi:hypothetical protein